MGVLNRRLSALEAAKPTDLCPTVKQWLGWALTEEEQAAADDRRLLDAGFDDIDTSDWSAEMRAWFGVN